MMNLNGWRRASAFFVLCAATAIAAPAQTFTTTVYFDGTNGSNPTYMSLVQGVDGALYGTTGNGGAYGGGTIFKVTSAGTLTTLYNFCALPGCADGDGPSGSLTLARDGNFYGTTIVGGANKGGTVFKVTPEGTLTTLYSFCAQSGCTDGQLPYAGVVQAIDGDFYGATAYGGPYLG